MPDEARLESVRARMAREIENLLERAGLGVEDVVADASEVPVVVDEPEDGGPWSVTLWST
jgi:hypothetical protein